MRLTIWNVSCIVHFLPRGLCRRAVSICPSVRRVRVVFYRASAYWRMISIWFSNCVCPSVCPTRYRILWKRLNILSSSVSSAHDSPVILVLSISNIFAKVRWGHPCGGAKYRWGIKISRFSTNKSLYLANDTRYRHSYYGRWIGTRMRYIKWCHFQWPWTNPNPVFKVTPLFDAEYLTNGYRYGHCY